MSEKTERIERMGLYEVETTRTGYSYVRAYVWAEGRAEAALLFDAKHPGVKAVHVRFLFYAREESFVTGLCDSGFGGIMG